VILERGGALKAPPPSAGEEPASPTPRNSRRLVPWLAALIVAAAAATVIYLRQRPAPQIPLPGVPPTRATALPTAAPAAEPQRPLPPGRPTAAPRVAATTPAVPMAPEAGPVAAPTSAPPPGDSAAEPRPTPHPARTGAARASSPERREVRPRSAIEGSVRRRPGWYRMRFRAPLFQEASETAPIVTYLPQGTRIRVTRVLPGFLAVESMTGKPPGYVSSDDAAPEEPAE
jgi:hypothetical protein